MISTQVSIPGYQAREQLYNGSRTLVYRGIRETDSFLVAIKLLKNPYPNFNELVQFRNQYTIAKNLNFPGIIQTISLEPYENSYILVMEDFGGISLKDYFAKNVTFLKEFLQIAISLCDTLDILSRHRIIHKDIKPANILINPETKQVKLIDFSIASLLPKEIQELKNINVLEGTLTYISPEQTGRMNRAIDYRTDFYSLGVTFYELLTGELPFQSNDAMELVHCHIAKKPTDVSDIKSEIPKVVGEIISKLMAKNAEDRYQSALGLKHDLEKCLYQLEETNKIEYFEIAQRDICDRFIIPDKLYGREAEVSTLLQAFERVSTDATEIMLVAGFSGIGKTAVVNEVHKPIVRQRGYFIRGKYDQFQRNIPFSAFVQAFRDLIGQLLTLSDAQIEAWKNQILEAVGDNGQVIIEVIPELEIIIGKQPPATELSGTAAQNRFNLLFQKFTQVFTSIEHPLVMFLDDLQWADSASLKLIQLLMAETKHLFLIGAYRDNEVNPAHPLMLTLSDIQKTQATINTITLAPLNQVQVNHLVADTLKCTSDSAWTLSQLVSQKTQGNPFFATQFLKALHQDGLIEFNYPPLSHLAKGGSEGGWQCDITQVTQQALTDDVVAFMAFQLRRLPQSTQNLLQLAACIGNQFNLATLAIVSELSSTETATCLWKALQEGLILPISDVYKFYQSDGSRDWEVTDESSSKQVAQYKFLHDRVQQAAYSLIAEDCKQATHLKMGQLLLRDSSSSEQEERLFEIVNHLNIGIALITQPQEQENLAQLNLAAGRKAKMATAYGAATAYLATGIELLPADAWESQYPLTLALHEDIAEVSYLNTDFEQMERWASVVLQQTKTLLDRIKVQQTRILGANAQGQLLEAIEIGLQVLRSLGIEFPAQPTQADIGQAFGVTRSLWADKAPSNFLDLPTMHDPQLLAAMEILTALVAAAYVAAPTLMPLLIFKQVELSIESGNCPMSVFGYGDYGLILCGIIGDIENGYEFGELALNLRERLQLTSFKCRSWYVVHTYVKHWKTPLCEIVPALQEAYHSGIETGEIEMACLSATSYCYYAYHAGQELAELAQTMDTYRQAVYQYKHAASRHYQEIYQQTVLNLLGQAEIPCLLTGEIFNQEKSLCELQAGNQRSALFMWHINQAVLYYLFGKEREAAQTSVQTAQYLDGGVGMFMVSLYSFFDALIQLTQYAAASPEARQAILLQVQQHQDKLHNWATFAPANHQHRCELVVAEQYRVLGNKAEAIEAYDRAIASAKTNNFIQDEALANELAAKFYLNWGKEKVAAGYMQEAYYCYAKWGAKAKVVDLETRYPQLLQSILQQPKPSFNVLETLTSLHTNSIHSTTQVSSSGISDALDFASVIKAAQALSSNIQLDELLKQLTQIILQNSGAEKCVLVLPQDDIWQVRAIATLKDTILCADPLDNHPKVPIKLIQYVKRMQTVVTIDNLTTDLPVIDDYLSQQQPKSVLCLPILNQGHLAGILYLKNRTTAGVFTSDRMMVVSFLCTQAAISLENAQLFTQQQEKIGEISQKEAEYRSIFESVNDGLSICDLETGKVIATNPTNCRMHGYSQAEWLHLNPQDFIHSDYIYLFSNFLENLRIGKEFSAQVIDKRKDGTYFDVEVKALPFLYKGKLHGLTIIRDISEQQAALRERQKAEAIITQKSQELEQALGDLQQSQLQIIQSEKMSALGNLVAGVAHEMNNPLGFIYASLKQVKPSFADISEHLKLYQESLPNPSEEILDHAESIDLDYSLEDLPKIIDAMLMACDRLKNISTSLRTFSRADKDYKVSFNIESGIDSTILILKHRLKANENRPAIEVITNYGKIPEITCFPGQLNQVFMNILANAIDALDESNTGRSFEEIKKNPNQITITTLMKNNLVKITIADNGKGMSEEVKQKIFDHLFTTKAVGKGTGLGLAIARQIVEETHGGKLSFNSVIGEDTEFIIELTV
jgi:PAS domain S-box-containing protein